MRLREAMSIRATLFSPFNDTNAVLPSGAKATCTGVAPTRIVFRTRLEAVAIRLADLLRMFATSRSVPSGLGRIPCGNTPTLIVAVTSRVFTSTADTVPSMLFVTYAVRPSGVRTTCAGPPPVMRCPRNR